MFPRFWLWGHLGTHSPEQVLLHCSSDHLLVPLVVLVPLESYQSLALSIRMWWILTSIRYVYGYIPRGAEGYLMVRNKSAIQIRVPHLLSFIISFGVDLVLNLLIVVLV